MKKSIIAALAVVGLGSTGCYMAGAPYATAGIYGDVTYSRNFESLTEADTKPGVTAHGESCASNILYIVNIGNAGYDAAYKAALASVGANSLYDVRVDTHITTVLGFIYNQVCLEVTGKYVK
jgi:hypothetical protein